jgi:hypothetical protein
MDCAGSTKIHPRVNVGEPSFCHKIQKERHHPCIWDALRELPNWQLQPNQHRDLPF